MNALLALLPDLIRRLPDLIRTLRRAPQVSADESLHRLEQIEVALAALGARVDGIEHELPTLALVRNWSVAGVVGLVGIVVVAMMAVVLGA